MWDKQRNHPGKLNSFLGWVFSHKKFAIGIMALMIAAPAVSAVVIQYEHSGVGFLAERGPLQYETYINGTSLANNNIPIYIGSHYYTSSNATGYAATQFGNATFTLPTMKGFTNGGYMVFHITIKNVGTSPLYINTSSNQFAYANYFVTDSGAYLPVSQTSLNPAKYGDGTAGGYTYMTNQTFMSYSGDLSSYLPYIHSLSPYDINWENQWYVPGSSIPMEISAGQSFSLYVFIGLGVDAPANLPAQYFSLIVPVTLTK